MNTKAIIDLLYKIADDQLIIGHRNSEWTGLGPILEEDIAFSSMAQDKIGQSLVLYRMLNDLGESDPDTIAFMRNANQFHNCQFVELPIGEFDFSIIRQFLFDTSEIIRFEMLSSSAYEPLALASKKFKGEIKYHIMHANSFMKQLGNATEESVRRLQNALDTAMPYALGIFETSEYEDVLIDEGIFGGETTLRNKWTERIEEVISNTALKLPDIGNIEPKTGGRYGKHTAHLQPLLDEMAEVLRIDPGADW